MRTGWKSDNVVGRSGVSGDEENTLFVATTGALISIGGVLAFVASGTVDRRLEHDVESGRMPFEPLRASRGEF